ncbi:hypothetical protein HGRIS_001373 [Hohenbuehelia grisea]|uniref:T6SS Phospholipase effector Tle1-like catalytic domain-containing protein n=1 Tax=Hohenbuehelia grisea TaxID=104357 RepID=A0ABR3JP52_9AGAR
MALRELRRWRPDLPLWFSRGACQVRVIAGMMKKVGLLHKENDDQIAFAYELYIATTEASRRNEARKDGKATHSTTNRSGPSNEDATGKQGVPSPSSTGSKKESTSLRKAKQLCVRFKETLSQANVKVHFVEAWETVSSIGVFRSPSLPETTTGMGHVCVFWHALALDECRVKFMPEYASDGLGASGIGDVKEVWFAGTHSDIGGGNTENMELDKFGPALRWMIYESIQHGLKTKAYSPKVQFTPDIKSEEIIRKIRQPQGSFHRPLESFAVFDTGSSSRLEAKSEQGPWATISRPTPSLTWPWRPLESLPLRRLSYNNEDGTTYYLNSGQSRLIQESQRIHRSVFDAINRRVDTYPGRVSLDAMTGWPTTRRKL